jgi:hypothetical protein
MITATKTPRKTPPRMTRREVFAAHALGGLVASQGEHILHAHRADYEKAVRSLGRTVFEIADEAERRAAA